MLKAIKKNVIIEMIQQETTTDSGLVLSGVSKDIPQAQVIAVGPEVDCGLVAGDRVVVDWARVGRMDYKDKIYYVTGQSNILAVFVE